MTPELSFFVPLALLIFSLCEGLRTLVHQEQAAKASPHAQPLRSRSARESIGSDALDPEGLLVTGGAWSQLESKSQVENPIPGTNAARKMSPWAVVGMLFLSFWVFQRESSLLESGQEFQVTVREVLSQDNGQQPQLLFSYQDEGVEQLSVLQADSSPYKVGQKLKAYRVSGNFRLGQKPAYPVVSILFSAMTLGVGLAFAAEKLLQREKQKPHLQAAFFASVLLSLCIIGALLSYLAT